MIGYRHADPRFGFLWETSAQPAARWHGAGRGPAHYFAETPDGAWAELLRHEGITDPDDVTTIRRALWAVELPDERRAAPRLPAAAMRGGLGTYADCQAAADRLRRRGATSLMAPSAALRRHTRSGWVTDGGLRPGPSRDERVIVLFGLRPDLVGWAACAVGQPRPELIDRVNPLRP